MILVGLYILVCLKDGFTGSLDLICSITPSVFFIISRFKKKIMYHNISYFMNN